MIRLTNQLKVFKSPRLTQPVANTGTNFTTHVINHDLGIIPDQVEILFDDGRLLPSMSEIGADRFYYFVDAANSSNISLFFYRYAVGDFYVVISARSDGDFDFS